MSLSFVVSACRNTSLLNFHQIRLRHLDGKSSFCDVEISSLVAAFDRLRQLVSVMVPMISEKEKRVLCNEANKLSLPLSRHRLNTSLVCHELNTSRARLAMDLQGSHEL